METKDASRPVRPDPPAFVLGVREGCRGPRLFGIPGRCGDDGRLVGWDGLLGRCRYRSLIAVIRPDLTALTNAS